MGRRLGLAAAALVAALLALAEPVPGAAQAADTSIRITSPLGRTGIPGVVRVVAQVTTPMVDGKVKVRFFVDDTLLGEDSDGPPYVAEWEDLNPYEPRVIRAEGPAVSFQVDAHDGARLVARGIHKRRVIDADRFRKLVDRLRGANRT